MLHGLTCSSANHQTLGFLSIRRDLRTKRNTALLPYEPQAQGSLPHIPWMGSQQLAALGLEMKNTSLNQEPRQPENAASLRMPSPLRLCKEQWIQCGGCIGGQAVIRV